MIQRWANCVLNAVLCSLLYINVFLSVSRVLCSDFNGSVVFCDDRDVRNLKLDRKYVEKCCSGVCVGEEFFIMKNQNRI